MHGEPHYMTGGAQGERLPTNFGRLTAPMTTSPPPPHEDSASLICHAKFKFTDIADQQKTRNSLKRHLKLLKRGITYSFWELKWRIGRNNAGNTDMLRHTSESRGYSSRDRNLLRIFYQPPSLQASYIVRKILVLSFTCLVVVVWHKRLVLRKLQHETSFRREQTLEKTFFIFFSIFLLPFLLRKAPPVCFYYHIMYAIFPQIFLPALRKGKKWKRTCLALVDSFAKLSLYGLFPKAIWLA